MSTQLEELLRERIERTGPMPFAAFMSLALYHPKHGYYTGGAQRTGWRGHFLTSAELDPAFGAMWAKGFEEIWIACGQPSGFHVVEVGPGEGGFAEAVLDHVTGDFAGALSYVMVERVSAVAQRQRARLKNRSGVTWTGSLDEVTGFGHGCVFANEVLDNLPVHLVEQRHGELLELCVEVADEAFVMTRRPPPQPELAAFLDRAGIELADGHRYEVELAVESLIDRAAGLMDKGACVFIDYGADARSLAERPGGSLICYSNKGVDTEPLESVGDKDITVHVNWTIVGAALRTAGMRVVGPKPQRSVLRGLGLVDHDDALRVEHQTAVGERRGADAVRALSRRQALGALADPAGLGGLDVVVGLRGIEPPDFLT
ncbi:MAG TPA: SAM-dependent methyltransferase [Actinomycetota bacterium]|nr:SAM-dependent methyltransferase [Actinomycetota bacterium]